MTLRVVGLLPASNGIFYGSLVEEARRFQADGQRGGYALGRKLLALGLNRPPTGVTT